METSNKQREKSLVERLLDGEEVVCLCCGKGIYRPVNPAAKINHYFVCDCCGDGVHWDPMVEVK